MLERIASSIAGSLNDFGKARDEDLNEDEGVEPEFNKDTNKFQTLADNYTDRMALVLKLGAGGDQQSHVHTPRSIKAVDSTSQYDAHSTNQVPHLEYENKIEKAKKFSSYTSQQPARAASAIGTTAQHNFSSTSQRAKRPFSNYNNQQQTLKRIKSELETISEMQNENKNEILNNMPEYHNTLVDESYSFSLRQFERGQTSNRDRGLPSQASRVVLDKGGSSMSLRVYNEQIQSRNPH